MNVQILARKVQLTKYASRVRTNETAITLRPLKNAVQSATNLIRTVQISAMNRRRQRRLDWETYRRRPNGDIAGASGRNAAAAAADRSG